jgi:pyruvate dehydrogenase E2 component (dihydrolipoamide acetyltransferase)
MTEVFRMPSLGADMEAGTLIEWTRRPGERLARGDTIAVIETQKGAIEVEVFRDAVMGRPLIAIGDRVPVGAPMAELAPVAPGTPSTAPAEPGASTRPEHPAGRKAGPPDMDRQPAPVAEPKPALEPPQRQPTAPTAAGTRHRASPAARRLAGQQGIDLAALTGSGPDGAVMLADVQSASAEPGPTPAPEHKHTRAKPNLAAMREAIAAAMCRSKREIPHYYLSQDIDLTPAADWLGARNAERAPDQRLLMSVLFIKAVALTLRDFPELNGFDREGRFEASQAIHVGCATAIRGGGLVAPALHDTDRLDLDTLMDRLRDLVARVRGGGLKASELSDPTVTVSSLGERGVDRLYGVIYPPQVAIVGFGTPRPRPWVVDGSVAPRTIVTATLSADHRHTDGHRGALFLARLAARLQESETL